MNRLGACLVLLCAVAVLASADGSRDAGVVVEVDMGTRADEALVGYGWSGRERNPERTFRWISRLEADVILHVTNGLPETQADYELSVLAAPFQVEGKRQNVGVFLDNVYVGEWVCEDDPGYFTYRVRIPRHRLKVGPNKLTLRMGYQQKPHRGDTRRLALAVDRIALAYGTPRTNEGEAPLVERAP